MLLFAVALLAGAPAQALTGPIDQFAHKSWAAQDGARPRAEPLVHPDSAPSAHRAVSQYQHDRWTAADGLPNHAIDWIQRSPDGYLWLGTEGGLVRFDGVRFTAFNRNTTQALQGSAFYPTVPLHVDRHGFFWISTSSGLVRYKDGVFIRAASAAQPNAPVITRMVEDRRGRLWGWVHDNDSPLYGIRDGRLVTPDPQSGLGALVTAVAPDPAGDVWVATVDRRLLRVHEGQAMPVLIGNAIPGGVTALYVARGILCDR
jgi:ligand-binding sensor domain-containing protein